jgi:hypothetical protein
MIRSRDAEEDEEIWSAIQYLDPDLRDQRTNSTVIVVVLSVALLICAVWVSLRLRGL